jgi:hypothetical protein
LRGRRSVRVFLLLAYLVGTRPPLPAAAAATVRSGRPGMRTARRRLPAVVAAVLERLAERSRWRAPSDARIGRIVAVIAVQVHLHGIAVAPSPAPAGLGVVLNLLDTVPVPQGIEGMLGVSQVGRDRDHHDRVGVTPYERIFEDLRELGAAERRVVLLCARARACVYV